MRKLLSFVLTLSLLLAFVGAAAAQAEAYAGLSALDASAFPKVSAVLDVFDAQGQFIGDLNPDNIALLEDGQPRLPDALSVIQPGARIVVAINPGEPFAVRDGEGVNRYERAMRVLRTWAESLPTDTADDLSLVTTAGPQVTYAKPADWLVNFNAYQPDFTRAVPSLQSLAFALDTALAQDKPAGTKSAILYITSRFNERDISTLEALQERLAENRVRVFVWWIDQESASTDPTAVAAKALAQQTGGQFFAFSGTESFPDPQDYFAPLRHAYQVTYTSAVNTAGSHTLEIQVKTNTLSLAAPRQTFSVDVQPPNAFLLAPPVQIIRQPPANDPYNDEILVPDEQPLELIIEFPDGHPRPLARTALYVNDEVVAVNEGEPFNHLDWDLSGYTTSGTYELKVEAVDSLGLTRVSLSVPVAVTVVQAPRGLSAFLARYRTQITAGAIVLAGMLLVGILVWGRVLRFPRPAARRTARQRSVDPVTQPVAIRQDRSAAPKAGAPHLPWARKPKIPQAPAYLVKLAASGEPATANPIPLLAQEMTFGTDPVQATVVLDDVSIAALHARLRQIDEGVFVLADQGSVAGTWINYEPVDRDGRQLKHGDIIHFGQLVYRFTLRTAPETEGPSVTPEATEE